MTTSAKDSLCWASRSFFLTLSTLLLLYCAKFEMLISHPGTGLGEQPGLGTRTPLNWEHPATGEVDISLSPLHF